MLAVTPVEECMEWPVPTHTSCHTALLLGITNRQDQQGSLHFRISFLYSVCIFYLSSIISSLLVTCEQKFTRLTNVWLEKLQNVCITNPWFMYLYLCYFSQNLRISIPSVLQKLHEMCSDHLENFQTHLRPSTLLTAPPPVPVLTPIIW